MKSADSLPDWSVEPPMHEGASVRPIPDRSGPHWDRLRYQFATAVDELPPHVGEIPSAEAHAQHPCRAAADAEVAAKAMQRLQASGYRALCAIECECERGILRLKGGVNSFFHLQLAQELVRKIEGVDEFLIDIRVVYVDAGSED
jgi:hypothetical protein